MIHQIRPVSYADEEIPVGEEVNRRMFWARMNGRVVAEAQDIATSEGEARGSTGSAGV